MGVVGYGHIGKHVAKLFQGLGLEVVRSERAGQDDAAVPALPLDELLATSDINSVSLPANDDTSGLIDARRIALIKPGAILIHIGRGEVVDDAAVPSTSLSRVMTNRGRSWGASEAPRLPADRAAAA